MADYTVAAGAIGKYEISLASGVESTVSFGAGDTKVSRIGRVEVKVLSGTKPVYFRFGTTAATVRGADCWDVHPGTAVVVEVPDKLTGDATVRLISEADAVVSVSQA